MIILQFIPSLLEFITFYMTLHFFLGLSFRPNKKDLFACVLVVYLSALSSKYTIASWVLGQLVYLAYTLSYPVRKLINQLLLYTFTYSTIVLSQLSLVFIMGFFNMNYDERYIPCIGSLIALFILMLIFKFTPYCRLYSAISNTAFVYKLILVNTYLLITAILLFLKINTFDFYQNLTYIISILAVMIAFNACMLFYEQRLHIEEQKVLSYQESLPLYKSLIDEIRSNQHEFTNRIQNLAQLPNICADYDSLSKALLHNTNSYQKPMRVYPLLLLDMPLLSATIYNLFCQANERTIQIHFDILSSHIESKAPEYDLSDYISILMHNAIDASSACDTIYIQMSSSDQCMHFEIRNPVPSRISNEQLSLFFQKGYTTKSDSNKHGRGLGLYYLDNQIKKYDGCIGVECTCFSHQNWIIFRLDV